jgi:hypothetical protein
MIFSGLSTVMIRQNTAIHIIPHSVRKRDAKQAPCCHHHWGRSKHIVAKGNVLLSSVRGGILPEYTTQHHFHGASNVA